MTARLATLRVATRTRLIVKMGADSRRVAGSLMELTVPFWANQ